MMGDYQHRLPLLHAKKGTAIRSCRMCDRRCASGGAMIGWWCFSATLVLSFFLALANRFGTVPLTPLSHASKSSVLPRVGSSSLSSFSFASLPRYLVPARVGVGGDGVAMPRSRVQTARTRLPNSPRQRCAASSSQEESALSKESSSPLLDEEFPGSSMVDSDNTLYSMDSQEAFDLSDVWERCGALPSWSEAKVKLSVGENGRGFFVREGTKGASEGEEEEEKEGVVKGEALVTIPLSNCLTVNIDIMEPGDSDLALALKLLQRIKDDRLKMEEIDQQREKEGKGEEMKADGDYGTDEDGYKIGFWAWYADTVLPSLDSMQLGAYWDDAQIEALQYEPSVVAAYAYAERFRTFAMRGSKNANNPNDPASQFSTLELLWALGIVNSRSYAAYIPEVNESDMPATTPELALGKSVKGMRILCPIVDLVNHKAESLTGGEAYASPTALGVPRPDATSQEEEEEDGDKEDDIAGDAAAAAAAASGHWKLEQSSPESSMRFVLSAPSDLEPNQEILMSYGAETNLELIMAYGFFPKENKADYLELFYDIEHMVEMVSSVVGDEDDESSEGGRGGRKYSMKTKIALLESFEASDAPLAIRPNPIESCSHLINSMAVVLASDQLLPYAGERYDANVGHKIPDFLLPEDVEDSIALEANVAKLDAVRIAIEFVDKLVLAEAETSLDHDLTLLADISDTLLTSPTERLAREATALQYRVALKKMALQFYLKARTRWELITEEECDPPSFRVADEITKTLQVEGEVEEPADSIVRVEGELEDPPLPPGL
uniref:SET domain-containing protein n=1 Tax=Lotharella globosa TaxID=91324 RepID=A0A6V3PDX8_9EUKA